MKKLLIIALWLSHFCVGHSIGLNFNTRYYDAVDKWVAFDTGAGDSTSILGFVYIDAQAGFTLYVESTLKQTGEGFEKIPDNRHYGIRQRLGTNTADAAVLSAEAVRQLDLPAEPDWLKHYKDNSDAYLLKTGLLYNSVGAGHNAIAPLLKVYEKEAHYKGLEFELAYAYNATKQFDKAIEVLHKAIKNDPKNFWFYKELGYACIHHHNPNEAEKAYVQGMKLTADKAQKAEMAFNMSSAYFSVKNKAKFDKWAKQTKEYAEADSQYLHYISYWEENWSK